MGWLSTLRRDVQARETKPEPYLSRDRIIWMPSKDTGGIWMNADEALRLSVVWACVTVNSKSLASCAWDVFLELENGDRLPRSRLATYALLNVRPNPEMTAFAFREAMYIQAMIEGDFFAEIEVDRGGRPVALWPLAYDRCTLERDASEALVLVVRNRQGGEVELPYDRVFHLHGPGIDGLTGYNVVSMAARSLAHAAAAERFGASFYHNGTQFGGLLSFANNLGPEIRKETAAAIKEGKQGAKNAWDLLVLDNGAKYEPFGVEPEKAQFIECCVAGTLLTMADGTRRAVENIRPGDEVVGWDDGPCIARIKAVGPPPPKPLVRVRTSRGRTLTATADHPMLAKRAMRTRGGCADVSAPEWIPLGDIEVGNHLRIGLGMPEDSRWSKIVDFETARLLGALTGDGYVRAGACSFTTSDEAVAESVSVALEPLGAHLAPAKSERPYDRRIAVGGRSNGPTGSKFRRLINDAGMVGRKAHEKRVPDIVMSSGPDAWRGFMSGYLDTDGCVSGPRAQQPVVYWSSVSRGLLEDCQHLLAMLGVQSAIYDGQPARPVTICGRESTARENWQLYVTGRSQLKKLSEILEPRHRERRARLAVFADFSESRYRPENWEYDRVIEIEAIGVGETIGIEVDRVHTHITNGIVTHNTRHLLIEETCRWFGTPPHKVAHLLRATFSNIEHQSIEFVRDALTPWAERARQEADWKLLRPWPGIRTRIDLEWLQEGDAKTKAEVDSIEVQNGLVSRNEARRRRGRNSIGPDGEKLTVQVSMTTLEKIGQDAMPPDPAVALFALACTKGMKRRARIARDIAERTEDAAALVEALEGDQAEHVRYVCHLVKEAMATLDAEADSEALGQALQACVQDEISMLAAAFEAGDLDSWCDIRTRAHAQARTLSALLT